jgi:hypothetical protein
MALTTRQTSLLVQQDWTKVYQTFREADFQSFDFETIRKSMIEYLRAYYPEDFNDFTESSEYIALIDLIAFLGQSLAFRADLNARENFIDTAERRDSVLKLARLLSYSPKRNVPASGLLKIDSISTTETLFDSQGTNLNNLIVNWNDTTNINWLEQFTIVLNAALITTQTVGKPGAGKNINGIKTLEYSLGILNNLLPVFPFQATVGGSTFTFEAVSATASDQEYIYEAAPTPTGIFNILYRNDNLGNESNNTGYFIHFKQGELRTVDFNVEDTLPNRIVNINFDNINNTDVWLYSLTSSGIPSDQWQKVPAVNGVNVIYNNSTERNLYSVSTRANDQIDLIFGDGSFTNIPIGKFRLYYRQSNNLSYKITPEEISNVPISFNYLSKKGKIETLTIRVSLQYTITNSSPRETLESIRTKAPQQYYTQNRMITGEDYNILPFTIFNNILKVKAVNRSSSGISRYLDVIDSTGRYSSTNIFAQDGIIYKEDFVQNSTFQFTNSTEVNFIIQNQIKPLISSIPTRHLFYDSATRFTIEGSIESASQVLIDRAYEIVTVGTSDFTTVGSLSNTVGAKFIATGSGTGSGTVKRLATWSVISSTNGRSVGTFSSPNYTYLTQGALIKFTAPTGKYFDAQNRLQTGTVTTEYEKTTIWASIVNYDNTLGPAAEGTISRYLPTGSIIDVVIPYFPIDWPESFTELIKNNVLSFKTFGIRYDLTTQDWAIIDSDNLSNTSFSLDNAGDNSSAGLDSSWFIKLSYSSQSYTVESRGISYYFQSVLETRFYFDPNVKVYDSKTAATRQDFIKVLRTNTEPDSSNPLFYSKTFRIWNNVIGVDGYEDNRKINITFPDDNIDSIPDEPDLFLTLVDPTVNPQNKFAFFVRTVDQYEFSKFEPIPTTSIVTSYSTESSILSNINLYPANTVFYATAEDKFFISSGTSLSETSDYIARVGRTELFFQYVHNAPNNRRIDPSPNNLIDLYLLPKSYSDDYYAYIRDTSNRLTEPTPMTNEELRLEYNSIEDYKSISDSLIYNSGVFKPLFGDKAHPSLRATFKIVKNPLIAITDNEVKSRVISALNDYFDVVNWDFGESFYFSELSTYLHNVLVPYVSSIIIVPTNVSSSFGTLFQINAEPNEILTSAATVDNVQIISAITAGQLNQ